MIWFAVLERFDGANNGAISLSVRDAAEYAGCSPNTAGRMLAQKPVAKGIRYSVVRDINVRYLCCFSVMAGTFASIVTTARVR